MPEDDEPPSDPPSSDMDVDMDTDPPSEADVSQEGGEGEGEMSLDELPAVKSKPEPEVRTDGNLRTLEKIYKKNSTATDLQMRVEPPPEQQVGTGLGTLLIPGWIRARAAEVLFEGDDVDECNLAEVVLDTLLKVLMTLHSRGTR
jgi:actin-related protein 10